MLFLLVDTSLGTIILNQSPSLTACHAFKSIDGLSFVIHDLGCLRWWLEGPDITPQLFMSNKIPIIPRSKTRTEQPKFDPKIVARFCERSASEETRRAYRRVTREFFAFVGNIHPSLVTTRHVLSWRDHLQQKSMKAATVSLKMSVVRSFFEFLKAEGHLTTNPAATRFVPPPKVEVATLSKALNTRDVNRLLSGPDRQKPDGARDYALLLVMLKLGVRVSEACSLRASSIRWNRGRWTIKFKGRGGRDRSLPLPAEVRTAIDEYLRVDAPRRRTLRCDGADAFLFQPHTNYRTLEFGKPLSTRMARNIVQKWSEFTGIERVSPHDLRRTAISSALDQGRSYNQAATTERTSNDLPDYD